MKKIMILIMSLMGGSAFAASTHLSLDNRTGTRVAAATERICFSPAWETDAAGVTAVVSVNGEVVKSATEAGVFAWTPPQDGIYRFTHAVFVGGVQVGETLSVTFTPNDLVPVTFKFFTGEGNLTSGGWGAWGCECDNEWHYNDEAVSLPEGVHEVNFEVRAGPDKDGVTRNWPAIFRVPESRSVTVEAPEWPFNTDVWVYPGSCHGSVIFQAVGLASQWDNVNWTPEEREAEYAKRTLDMGKCSVRVWNNETGEYIDLPVGRSYFLSDGKYTVRGMYDGNFDSGEWAYAGDPLVIDTQKLFDSGKDRGDNYRKIKLSYIRTDEPDSLFRCKFDVNAEDAVVDVVYMTVKNGTAFNQAFPKPRRPGYYFVDWFTKAEGGESVRSLVPFQVDLTTLDRDWHDEKVAFVFYAHWEKDEDIRMTSATDGGRYISKVHDGIAELLRYETFYESVNSFLLLPDSLDGYPLGKIRSGFLDGGLPITEVEIPESVIEISAGAFKNCAALEAVKFNGPLPAGVNESGILNFATAVRYPRKFSAQYEDVVPLEIFAGYTDEKLIIETEQLTPATEMVDYEVQLECSGGAEPYSWWMSEDGYRIDTETNSFAEVGEAQGWHTDSGAWEYELPFAFNCCGRTFKMVRVDDDANLEFDDDLGRYASIYSGFGDLYSEGVDQDIFVEQGQDRVTFRWKRVKYSERDNDVNYAVTLYSNGVIRCSFGECTDAVRSVEVYGDLIYGAYVEQEGDDDIVLVPNYLPIGLSLDEDGIIRGVPEQAGHYDFEAMVQDDEGEICSKMLSVDVAANPNRRPVVAGCEPSWNKGVCLRVGESASFAVAATDPDGDELSFRWFLDGVEIAGADAASCALTSDMTMRGKHWLTCTVSDGVWSVGTSGWSISIGGELFVNAEDGADALQSALNDAIDGDVIYVGPGTYSPVEVPWLQRVRIVATDGCANTIVDGCHSASCFRVAYNGADINNMVRIEGFTLQDGFAEMGGGANGAWLIGCVVRNNAAELSGGGVAYGRADNCLIVGNTAQYGGGAVQADLYNCTVVGNVAEQYHGGRDGGAEYNSIIWGNESEYDDSNVDDPMFVDADNGDYRLSEGSPCIGMGDNSLVATAYDLAGNVRIQGGSVDLGAYESAYSLPRPDAVAWLSISPRTYATLLDWADATYAKWYKVYRVEDALDDSAAELIATVSDASHEDESAVYGTDYRYWVVPCNEVGEGERSEPEVGGLLPPLNIVDAKLPDATSGSGYEFALQATGGDGCYSWSVPTYDVQIEEQSTFEKVGEPMGWFDDDASWNYELPFDFPLGEDATSVVEVDDNGYLTLPFESETVTVYAAWDLDLYANPGDVYVSKTDDDVTFRWERVVYTTGEAVNVSATLYANGCIRLSCDSGVASVARGLECQDADYWCGVPGDVVLTPNTPPPGLELSDDGVLSGEPTDDGAYRFAVKVEDGNGERATRKISLNVKGDSTDPIPDIGESPSAIEVYEALEGSTDSELQVNITDAATYNAYREWALKIGAAEVKVSPFAWVSFATDSAALLAKMPTDDDLKVEEFKPSATAGSFDFTVSVKDVTIGDKASVDNLKKLFGLEGAESFDAAAFSSENVSLDFKEPQDGKLKFTATPAVDNAKSFFMKVKVR